MPAENRTPHTVLRLVLGALLFVAVLLAVLPAVSGRSHAETVQEELSATEQIVTALEESPVHIDPSYANAFPEEHASDMAQQITDSNVLLRVLVVPLIDGGEWSGEAERMVAAVHDRIGDKAHYLVLDGRSLSGHDFVPEAPEEQRAHYGSLTATMELGHDAQATELLDRAVEVAISDDPRGEYETADEERERGPTEWLYSLGPLGYVLYTVLPWILLVLALIGLGFGVHRWRRPRAVPLHAQHAAFDSANRARRDELARKAGEELVRLGERLSDAAPVTDDPGATGELRKALDVHAAARRVHDALPETEALVDIVGVLVLLDMAKDHMDRATLPARRRSTTPVRSHCYANPLHGTDTKTTTWREFGGRQDIEVPLCDRCAKAVRDRFRPTVLPDHHDGQEVAYYEVPTDESVWSATGFGTLRADLVERILRGDHAIRVR